MRDADARVTAAGAAFVLLGGVVFVLSLLAFVWFWFFRWGVPEGAVQGRAADITVNLMLFTVFALHHSVFARLGLRARVRQAVGPQYERSVYVWVSSLVFFVVCVMWRPVGGVLWSATGSIAVVLYAVEVAGMLMSVRAAGRLDVFDLAGVRQAFPRGSVRPDGLVTNGLYGIVRHPVYLGWLLLVWAPPVMTGTRLVFAAISTIYLVIAVPFEERALRSTFGSAFDTYARHVRWRMIPGLY